MKLSRLANNKIPELVLNDLQLSMKEQIELKVDNGIYGFEEVGCPICEIGNSEPIGEKDRYGLYYPTKICTACGLIYTSPRMTKEAYHQFYNIEYRKLYGGAEMAHEFFFLRQRKQGRKIFNYLAKTNALGDKPMYVLEVGCGAGGILDYFAGKGHRVKGIDLGEEYITYGKREYGLDLESCTLSDLNSAEQADLIIYSHVLEHILDMNAEIELIKKYSHANTILYIEVPGIKEIHKNYESNILKYFQNAHTYHFTLESLVNLMRKHGFESVTGNQFVKAIFRLSDSDIDVSSDYGVVLPYLEKIEKRRGLFQYTYWGIKSNLLKFLTQLADFTETRGIIRSLRNTHK